MDYFLTIWSVIVFIENRIQEKIDYSELEKATGFSLAHIRDVFVKSTGIPLSMVGEQRHYCSHFYE